MKKSIVFFVFLFFYLDVAAQEKYNFTEQFTFETTKEGKKVEFSVFLEPKTSTWLFTKDDTFNGEVEDINQWILKPNGQIIMLGSSEHNDGKIAKVEVKNFALKATNKAFTQKPIGKQKTFGKNQYSYKTYLGLPYRLSVGRAVANVFLTKTNYNFSALYAYNFCLDIETYLPGFSKVNYTENIPKNYMVLEDSETKFISVSPTEYYVEIPK